MGKNIYVNLLHFTPFQIFVKPYCPGVTLQCQREKQVILG